MDDLLLLNVVQCIENLDAETPDQRERKTFEVAGLQKVIQIDREELEGNAKMVPKLVHLFHADDVVLVVRIVVSQMRKYFHFNLCLVLKFLTVLDDFDRHDLFLLVVVALNGLTKAATPKLVLQLIAIRNVVSLHNFVVSSFVIVPIVEFFEATPFNLPFAANIVNLSETKNFALFEISKLVFKRFDGHSRLHREISYFGHRIVLAVVDCKPPSVRAALRIGESRASRR